MIATIVTLMFAGAAAAQTLAPAPKPAPSASEAAAAASESLAESMKLLQRDVERMAREQIARMAELGMQFPVPPVPPVSPAPPVPGAPRNPREPREARRRFPEGWVESTETYSRTFTVSKGSALRLTNISGNIQVSPGSGDQVDVQALKHAWGPNPEESKRRLADATVEAYATASRVEIRVEHTARRDSRGLDVEFSIKVPPDGAVDLRTVSGDIRVANVRGEVRVQAISGNLLMEATPQLGAATTVSGDIRLVGAGAEGQLSLSTVSGDLEMQTLTARMLDLNTVSGDVRINGWTGNRANIRTLSGDLDLTTSFTSGGRYEIESHSGDVRLSLPERPGFEVEAHTYSGRIRIDFPIKSEGPIRDQDSRPRSVRGTYGDGSSSLRLQTFSGNVTVIRH